MRPEIADFWSWWHERRAAVEAALADEGQDGIESLAQELTARVKRIHPALQWEVRPGEGADHALCVTGGGVRGMRVVAERWRAAAPPGDATWEYRAARPPDRRAFAEGERLQLQGVTLELAHTRFEVTVHEDRQVADVTVDHPAFVDLPAPLRAEVTYRALDLLLGEDAVERWLGAVTFGEGECGGEVAPDSLLATVRSLEDSAGEPGYALLHGTDADGLPVLVTARQPLKPVEHPLFDLHGELVVDYETQPDSGLPTVGALEELTALEDSLVAAAGEHALLAAVVSRQGQRTFHLYADADGPAPVLLESWSALRSDDPTVTWRPDPAWDAIRPFQ